MILSSNDYDPATLRQRLDELVSRSPGSDASESAKTAFATEGMVLYLLARQANPGGGGICDEIAQLLKESSPEFAEKFGLVGSPNPLIEKMNRRIEESHTSDKAMLARSTGPWRR